MSTLIIFQQIFVLFAMMVAGYLAFRVKYFDQIGQHQISVLIANVLNPFVMLSAIAGERPANADVMMRENILCAAFYMVFMVVCSYIYVFVRRPKKKARNLRQLMLAFSNVGFFVIPIVRALFGDSHVIFLVFYMLFFNLAAYTFGIYLAVGAGYGKGPAFSIKQIINPGTVSSILAIILYMFNVKIPAPFATIFSYMGNACIPLSMILIGASLAQLDLKSIILSGKNWAFTAVKMLLIPVAGILLGKLLPVSGDVRMIMNLEFCMPVASIAGVFAEEYANRGNDANKLVALTTLVTIVTVPLLSLLF